MTFKQFLLEYTDYTKKYTARHQKKNGLVSGFVNRPRKTLDLVAQYRKDKTHILPAIQKLKEFGGAHICTPTDVSYIRETYPQLDLNQLDHIGKALGKTGIKIKKNRGQYIIFR